jgi:hypothetical protein
MWLRAIKPLLCFQRAQFNGVKNIRYKAEWRNAMTQHEIETVMTVGAAEDRAFGRRSLGTAVAEDLPIRRRGTICGNHSLHRRSHKSRQKDPQQMVTGSTVRA